MPATKLLGIMKKGWQKFADPAAETRIDEACHTVRAGLKKHRERFRLSSFVDRMDVFEEDLPEIRRRVYLTYVVRVWEDLILTEKEEATLNWISASLELDEQTRRQLHSEYGKQVFSRQLSQAMSDGVVSDAERELLDRTASWMGMSVENLIGVYFCDEGEGFLHNVFLTAIEDGVLLEEEWQRFLLTAKNLGFNRKEAFSLVAAHAERFVEHVLADAKSDNRLEPAVRDSLQWMLNQFELPQQFVDYVDSEIRQIELCMRIATGWLPSLDGIGVVELRAGEIVHFRGDCVFSRVRQLRSGTKIDRHDGDLVITDNRLIFSSDTKPFVLPLRRVISLSLGPRAIDIRANATATGTLRLGDASEIGGLILETAVRRANQKITRKASEQVDRHIPREVRQRVWQRYGGRCVDCGSDQYLEFDHIIPVAKGGSNFDENIQLLCRKCNLTKSDKI